MDFFSKQDQARRKTGLLILYFILAVICIVLVINAAIYLVFQFTIIFFEQHLSPLHTGLASWFSSPISFMATLVTVMLIMGGSLYRLLALSDGGVAVAAMVGATPLSGTALASNEKILRNVVEEMAIASGMPVPQIFVMENESAINAFVAGFRSTESVLIVTSGLLKQLSRDELQGVVGHEFSHILNGDMRINLRLIAILSGILLIGKIGEWLMRGAKEAGGRAAIFLLLSGALLYVAGYAGLFFGRIIKAAISRQREFLADASAVQFTRNTKGLAGALYKIRTSVSGSRLHSVYAEDLSHMCIGEAMPLSSWLSTHPSLDLRIQTIDPSYMGTQRAKKIIQRRKATGYSETVIAGNSAASMLSASVGNIDGEQLAIAGEMHANIPNLLKQNLYSVAGAASVVYALLGARTLSGDIQPRVNDLLPITEKLNQRMRLPLIDMALPALKRMAGEQRQQFLSIVERIIKNDNRYTLNEFVIFTIIKQQLSAAAGRADSVKYHSFKPLLVDVQLILSMMLLCSGQSQQRRQRVWQRAIKVFAGADLPMLETTVLPSQISAALGKIRQASMWLRKNFIDVCADMVMDDGIIMPAEAELLRAICESIDCPMPLLAASRQETA